MEELFFDPKKKHYYLNKSLECNKCRDHIKGWAMMVISWNRNISRIDYYCKSCFNKVKNHSIVSEYKLIILAEPPITSVPIILRPPTFIESRKSISCFEAARLNSDVTINKTKLADTFSLEGAKIGKEIPKEKRLYLTNEEKEGSAR